MFSLLNIRLTYGKHRARMRKFLNSLTQIFRNLWRPFSKTSYLIEEAKLRGTHFPNVGHRIAFSLSQPVLLEIRFRKD